MRTLEELEGHTDLWEIGGIVSPWVLAELLRLCVFEAEGSQDGRMDHLISTEG